MRVLLVSTRGGPEGHAWWERSAKQATALRESGHQVSWLLVLPPGEDATALPEGLDIRRVVSSQPGYVAVEAQLEDAPGELALIRELRDDPPDVVHIFGYGGTGSASMPWVCARLGVPAVVTIDLGETLCHRGTLIEADGSACARWDDPRRCLQCCLAPGGEGLSAAQAWRARVLRFLGPLSPYPRLSAFENRIDIVLGGLTFAQRIIVADRAAAETLMELGVAERLITIDADTANDYAPLVESRRRVEGSIE